MIIRGPWNRSLGVHPEEVNGLRRIKVQLATLKKFRAVGQVGWVRPAQTNETNKGIPRHDVTADDIVWEAEHED